MSDEAKASSESVAVQFPTVASAFGSLDGAQHAVQPDIS